MVLKSLSWLLKDVVVNIEFNCYKRCIFVSILFEIICNYLIYNNSYYLQNLNNFTAKEGWPFLQGKFVIYDFCASTIHSSMFRVSFETFAPILIIFLPCSSNGSE